MPLRICSNSLLLAQVQRRSAQEEIPIAHLLEAGLAHQSRQRFLVRETGDRVGEILVRARNAGNKSSNARQNAAEVKAKDRTDNRQVDAGELQNGERASALEHAAHFLESTTVIGKIAKAEGNAHHIERSIAERKSRRVRLEVQGRMLSLPAFLQ